MIRKFSDRDANKCRELFAKCFEKPMNLEELVKQALLEKFTKKGWLESQSRECLIFVYENSKKIIGIGALRKNEIEKLYIEPLFHRRGIGTEILNFLEDQGKKARYSYLVLHAFQNSIGFYQKQGYKIIGTYHHRPRGKKVNIETIKMRKEIRAGRDYRGGIIYLYY